MKLVRVRAHLLVLETGIATAENEGPRQMIYFLLALKNQGCPNYELRSRRLL